MELKHPSTNKQLDPLRCNYKDEEYHELMKWNKNPEKTLCEFLSANLQLHGNNEPMNKRIRGTVNVEFMHFVCNYT